MVDVFTKAKRSEVMSRIRGRDNASTELFLIHVFKSYGIKGWKRKCPLFGRPDFVFQKQRLAVFVDGCYWHRHTSCKYAYTPKSRLDFWLPKFERNVARDLEVNRELRKSGWKVIRVWECHLAKRTNWPRIAARIKLSLQAES